MTQINDLTISPKPPSSSMTPNLEVLDQVIAQCATILKFESGCFDDEDYAFAKMIHHRYPDIPFYLQVGNPYLADDVANHTENYCHDMNNWLKSNA